MSDFKSSDFNEFERQFFADEQREKEFGGWRGLAARAFKNSKTSELANKEETIFHFTVAKLCTSLTQKEHGMLADVFKMSLNQSIFEKKEYLNLLQILIGFI